MICGPGRPGQLPTRGSHRFRTCPIKASGSSSHGRPRANGASPALRSGGVTVTGARVSVHPPCCPPTGRDSALPFLHRVPAGRVPLLQRYYGVLRRPAADPAALRCSFAWPYLPVRLCSLPRTRRRPGAWSFGSGSPTPETAERQRRDLSGSWGILLCLCHVLRPRQDRLRQDLKQSRHGPHVDNHEGSRKLTLLSRLNRTACALAVYASPWGLLRQDARLASRCCPLYGTGLVTRRIPTKGFRVASYISSPFPKLA